MAVDKEASVIIAGAGVFGLSTAWHLAKAGYSNITVLDKHAYPSAASAGNDLNKIFRTEYSDPLYSTLSHEAHEAWLSEPILKGLYHESGYVFAVSGRSETSVKNWEEAVANSKSRGVRRKCAALTGPLKGWRGVYNEKAGWTHARKALQAVAEECSRLGVKFIDGEKGNVASLITENGCCKGLKTIDGSTHFADITIIATGAWMDSVVDTKGQIVAKAWCYAHIDLTEEEARIYKDMPVINNRELGYLFEPDEDDHKLKVAPHGVGYTNIGPSGKSTPRCKTDFPSDRIPDEARSWIRKLLQEAMPNLADRRFTYERLCWDGDTLDAHFLVTPHPEQRGLFLAGGGSAHAFKFLPTIGKYVLSMIEGTLSPETQQAWRWRPNITPKPDMARPNLPPTDLVDVKGWQSASV